MGTMVKIIQYTIFLLQLTTSSFCQVNYLFSHGIADSRKQALWYLESVDSRKPYIVKHPLISFNYPDAYDGLFKINRLQSSLAQDNEVSKLAQIFFASINELEKAVLVGVSRGASALVNFEALYGPENVAALVLESPFDCVDSILTELINTAKLSWIPGIKKNGLGIMSFIFCKYKPNGMRPIDLCERIKKDLPILIICSTQDALVPVWSSINLYLALRESGHSHAYILVLPRGNHAKLINDRLHGPLYQQVTHAFYQKFDLPHDPHLANLGAPLLANCQPCAKSLSVFYPSHAPTPINQATKDSHAKKQKK